MKRWNREIEGARPWMNRGSALRPLFLPECRWPAAGRTKGGVKVHSAGGSLREKIDRFPGWEGKGRVEAQLRSKVRLSKPLNGRSKGISEKLDKISDASSSQRIKKSKFHVKSLESIGSFPWSMEPYNNFVYYRDMKKNESLESFRFLDIFILAFFHLSSVLDHRV